MDFLTRHLRFEANSNVKQFLNGIVSGKYRKSMRKKAHFKALEKSINLLTKNNVHLSDCKLDYNCNIVKMHLEEASFWWESKVYLSLVEMDIFPLMTASSMKITYFVGGLMPLRVFLKRHSEKYVVVLYELFSFVKRLMDMGFLHGNLHIDNIYVGMQTGRYTFKLIDLSNSYIKGSEIQPIAPFYRSSFLGEFDTKEMLDEESFWYWDFFTLVASLKCEFVNNKANTVLTDEILGLMFDPAILTKLSNVLSPAHKTMYFERPVFWEDFA